MGNRYAYGDWGHAKDYLRIIWMILQTDEAEDSVIANGIATTGRNFVKICFAHGRVELEFKGDGIDEKGYKNACNNPDYQVQIGKEVIAVDESYFRRRDVELLIGDATKAKEKLGWVPEYDLSGLIEDMMSNDLILMKKHQYPKEGGYTIRNYFE